MAYVLVSWFWTPASLLMLTDDGHHQIFINVYQLDITAAILCMKNKVAPISPSSTKEDLGVFAVILRPQRLCEASGDNSNGNCDHRDSADCCE